MLVGEKSLSNNVDMLAPAVSSVRLCPPNCLLSFAVSQAPSSPPVSSLSIPYELQQVQPTKAPVREVQSLCANPSNGQQMAVALEGGV